MEFFSHPDKMLKDHVQNVADSIKKKILITEISSEINKNELSEIGFLIGLAHDFGKFTSFFQDKLPPKEKDSGKYSNHGLLSAIFGFHLSQNYLLKNNLNANQYFNYMPLLVYQIIKHHHGNLLNITDDVAIQEEIDIFKEQFENVSTYASSEIKDLYNEDIKSVIKLFFEPTKKTQYPTKIEYDLAKIEYEYNFLESNNNLKSYYFIINQFLYSLLISFDKIDASEITIPERKIIESGIVSDFKKIKFGITESYVQEIKKKDISTMTLNDKRELVYNKVLDELENSDIMENKIFTITAPTGLGKTLTSFAAALKIKEKTKSNLRIIYSLPFTSIIEQNYGIIDDDILKSMIGDEYEKNKNAYLLKHHYFANIEYKDNNEYKPVDDALMLIENWDSEIIVTTFIQLFYTLIGYENRMLKKFHNIVNSVIILDEVQNIPVKYWKIINTVLKLLTQYFKCYVILLTATRPLIFNHIEAKELLVDNEKLFKSLNRTKIINESYEKLTVDDLYKKIVNDIKNQKYKNVKSILVIMNTIKSSIQAFDFILKDIINFKEFKKIYLSTNITPHERKNRIEAITECVKKNDKIIVISTQLIEAGVDIDMDLIYRDMAPLDSIIQSAGRANRSGNEEKKGYVKLVCIKSEDNKIEKELWTYIYDKISVRDCTIPVFKEKEIIDEAEYYTLINNFFSNINEKKSKEISDKLLMSLNEFYFYQKSYDVDKRIPLSEFKLIDNLPGYVSLFVEIDDTIDANSKNSKWVWNEFMTTVVNVDKTIKDYWKIRKENFLKIKGFYYNYLISIPEEIATANDENIIFDKINDDLYYLKYENLRYKKNEIIYDLIDGKGFNRDIKINTLIL